MIKKHVTFLLASLLVLAIFAPHFSSANGGNQRVVEGKYIVQISQAPLAPYAGEKVAMLVSFFDIAKDSLILTPINARLRIAAKAGEEVLPWTPLEVDGGIAEFSYTYAQSGFYEIFVEFERLEEPGKKYQVPDFLLDVKPQPAAGAPSWIPLVLLGTAIVGLLAGFIAGRATRPTAAS